MVKNGPCKIFLIFLFCIFIQVFAQSQNRKYFIITGKIISESASIENGSIQITKINKPSVFSEIPENGRFRLELDYNSEYQLIFAQKGLLPKTVIVNTDIPQEVLNSPENFPHFLMAIKLFKDNQDPANLYSGNQAQQITYFGETNSFSRVPTMFDVEYVDKGGKNQNPSIQSQENKTKMQVYHIF